MSTSEHAHSPDGPKPARPAPLPAAPEQASAPPAGLAGRARQAPGALSPAEVLQLQPLVGNHAVNRSLAEGRPAVQRVAEPWRATLEAALGAAGVAELQAKAGEGALAALAKQLPSAAMVRSVVRAFTAEQLRTDLLTLRPAYVQHAAAIGLENLNFLVDMALKGGWAAGSLAGLIAAVARRSFGEWAHILVRVAAGAGWTAAQTADVIDAGYKAGSELDTIATQAAGRGWSGADLAGILRAMAAQNLANWGALAVAMGEAEVNAAELAASFPLQSRFTAGKPRVGGRANPPSPHAACIPLTIPGSNVRVYMADGDVAHFKSGHSYPDFALTRANVRRAPQSTFFPPGTDVAATANASLQAAAGDLQAVLAAGPHEHVGVYAGNQCMFYPVGGGSLDVRMDQCFPTAGEPVSKGTLLAVKAFVQP